MASPTITAVTPSSGPPGTQVTVNGLDLSVVTSAKLGTLALSISNQTDTAFDFVVPTAAPAGSSGLSLAWAGIISDPGGFAVTGGGGTGGCNPPCVSPEVCVNGTCVGPPPPPPPSGSGNNDVILLGLGAALLAGVAVYAYRSKED